MNTSPIRKGRGEASTKCATRACDPCRLRKTRCSISRPCELCALNGFECTFLNPQKKRGPPAHRVAQIRQQKSQSRQSSGGANNFGLANSHETSLSTTVSGDLSSFDSSQIPPDLIPDIVPVQISTSPSEDQHRLSSLDNPREQGYDLSLILNNTTTEPTAWNSSPHLESLLPDSFNSQTGSLFGFPGANLFVKQTLPPIIDDLNVDFDDPVPFMSGGINVHNIQSENPIDTPHGGVGTLKPDFWPPYIHEENLIPWIDVFFDRLHPTLPVLDRSSLFTRMFQREHRQNRQFGSMILSLCAFSLTQPIDISERPSSSSRADHARMMMTEATKMRSSSDFGENPTVEAVLTSFFLFGFLFGSNQHNAARLRLREAVDLASILGLNDPRTYANCSSEDKGQFLRIYLVLSVTERAYALQRRLPISFIGPPLNPVRSVDEMNNTTQRLVSGIIVHNDMDAAAMMGLTLLMEIFDAIDEEILVCWNSRCSITTTGKCQNLTESKVLNIYHNIAGVSNVSRYMYHRKNDHFDVNNNTFLPDQNRGENRQQVSEELDEIRILRDFLSETQCADVLVTQKWVQDRLWNLCFSHGLLRLHSEQKELCFRYAFDNAVKTLELCRSLRISAMEAHGVGMIEKLYNIATSALINLGGVSNEASEMQIFDSAMHELARNYLRLMQTLRGGHHPYMGQYNAYLKSLGFIGPNDEWKA
ncbi:hypothetical protein BGW36DRAFT_308454 [Talaromyces proteolyticus]|uniref:Zn(2)-C6 fungal-type domain-containing protein n=1 Tax=Talaromyces proteolyticus TaxID=1131652 RepID=A0AAD4PUP1_9EURO|nr:uncharacterized protein BGW36DRAFT_308454 [Talaromyces proteolyticus]KAH8689612.1 hypothetical protein BGW36DRAFT_308454 [Talaromyces proteolyticus]